MEWDRGKDGDNRPSVAHSEPLPTDSHLVGNGPPPRPWRLFALLTGLFFTIGLAWSFSTAPGSSPDETAHLWRAWTVWDHQILLDPAAEGGAWANVPEGWVAVPQEIGCFAFKPSVTADCAEPWPAERGALQQAWLSAGRYPPVYYLIVGWPLQFSEPLGGLYATRMIASLLGALLLAAATVSVCLRPGSVLARAGVLVGLTPLAMFLAATVNPSGLEICGAVCGWTGAILLARQPSHPAMRWWAVCAAVGLSCMTLSRPASFLWLAPVAVVLAILIDRDRFRILVRRRAVQFGAAVVALSVVSALGWTVLAGSSNVQNSNGGGSLWDGFVFALQDSSGWWAQQVGTLGWLDTPAPLSVLVTTVTAVVVLVLLALALLRGRDRLAQLVSLAFSIIVPLAAATAVFPGAGRVWQGRYSLPVTIGSVILAGILLDDCRRARGIPWLSVGRWLAGLWGYAGIGMVFFNMQRYSVGTQTENYLYLFQSTPWSPPIGTVIWVLVAMVGYAGVVLCQFPPGTNAGRVDKDESSGAPGQMSQM